MQSLFAMEMGILFHKIKSLMIGFIQASQGTYKLVLLNESLLFMFGKKFDKIT